MAAMLARCRVHSTHAGAPPRLVRKARCLPLAARAGRGTSVACESSREDPSCAAEAAARQDTGRRRVLAGIALPLALLASPLAARAVAEAPATDLIEGTQRLAGLGIQALEVQLQQAASGEGEGGSAELQERRRRFGVITVPGLSSFSFIHGALVGCAVIALLAADRLGFGGGGGGGGSSSSSSGAATPAQAATASGLDPEVEAALRSAISDASATFHDPQVHAAIEDVRSDISAISKYRDDPAVMGAFQKLLEIEGILERL